MRDYSFFTYILASKKGGTLYVGVTNDIFRRVGEHREGLVPGFTRKYSVKRLVWFQEYQDVEEAIQKEKSLKKWKRQWKIDLIEQDNPDWNDLYRNFL